MDENSIFASLLNLISDDKLTELEAERLLNAATRLRAGVPTGSSRSHEHTQSLKS